VADKIIFNPSYQIELGIDSINHSPHVLVVVNNIPTLEEKNTFCRWVQQRLSPLDLPFKADIKIYDETEVIMTFYNISPLQEGRDKFEEYLIKWLPVVLPDEDE
jgi:hypothetical protein